MPDTTDVPEPAERLEAGRVAAVFTWHDDRWRHAVFLDGVPRYESLEGPEPPAADPRWPASPVLTEVSLVATAGGTAVVGVGRAGRSHFSLSLTRHPTRADTIVVEAACRIHEPPGRLGSTYRPLARSAAAGPAAATTAGEREPEMIRVEASPGMPHAAPLPRTVTWSYVISPAGIAPLPPAAGPAAAPHA